MKTLPLADARILSPVVAYLESNGARSEAFLDLLSIPGEMIESGGMIAKKQCHDMLMGVARSERCEQIGFAAYQGLRLRDLGPIGTAMATAMTVHEAIETFTRMASLAYEGNHYFIRQTDGITWLCFRDLDHVSEGYVYSHHVTMMAYVQMIRELTGQAWFPRVMRLHGAPSDSHAQVEEFVECRPTFSQEYSAIAVPTHLLRRRLSATLSQSDAHETEPTNEEKTFAGSLQRFIQARFAYRNLPTLEHVASIFGMSPRMVQACLQQEGLSYRRLLDRVRFDAATRMLEDQRATIQEIALELGYSGSSNFVRSFRRMTGVTPAKYRACD